MTKIFGGVQKYTSIHPTYKCQKSILDFINENINKNVIDSEQYFISLIALNAMKDIPHIAET